MIVPCPVAVAARRWPTAPAIIWQGEAIPWAALDGMVRASVAALRARGVGAEDRVAVASWNRPELVALFFACGRLGAALVPLNMRLSDAERAELLAIARPAAVVDLPLAWPVGGEDEQPDVVAERVAAALFTSGTTGQPSLVELTHANFIASADASAENLGAAPSHRWLATLPLFHVGGLAMADRCARAGATLVLEPGFVAARASRLFDEGVTHASLVPTTLERLLDARAGRPFAGVEAVLVGGGPMTPELLARARSLGLPVLQTYGLTEACSQVTTERLGEADGLTAGPAIAGVQLRVVDEAGTPVPEGVVGEIEVSGPTVARGLGPWLKTKDLGSLDARGRLSIASRRVDLIVTGGENVYPAEVEAVLRQHPAVRDVAVVPRPHATFGQEPVGVVVLAEACEDAELADWARARIAHFKVPKVWVRVDELPRNAGGKLERRKIQALAIG
ncbi:MAG: AMP-binding protein [Myxococcota bacterium]